MNVKLLKKRRVRGLLHLHLLITIDKNLFSFSVFEFSEHATTLLHVGNPGADKKPLLTKGALSGMKLIA